MGFGYYGLGVSPNPPLSVLVVMDETSSKGFQHNDSVEGGRHFAFTALVSTSHSVVAYSTALSQLSGLTNTYILTKQSPVSLLNDPVAKGLPKEENGLHFCLCSSSSEINPASMTAWHSYLLTLRVRHATMGLNKAGEIQARSQEKPAKRG